MIVDERQTRDLSETTPVFRRILFAVDFSPASQRALCVALPLAAENAQLAIVHVAHIDWRYEMLETPPEIDFEQLDAEHKFQTWFHRLALNRKFESVLVREGPVAQAIVSVAAKSQADLLVLGTRGRGGLQKLALGSVAEEVLRIAPCPVATIGPRTGDSAHGRPLTLRTILFATDFGHGSTKALPIVLSLAKQHRSKLILLHFIPPMPATATSLSAYAPATAAADELQQWQGTSRKRSLDELRAWLPDLTGLQQEPEYIVGTDFLPEGLLTAAERYTADLIVMGASHRGSARFASHIPWTTVHAVVRDAPCPVLTVAG